ECDPEIRSRAEVDDHLGIRRNAKRDARRVLATEHADHLLSLRVSVVEEACAKRDGRALIAGVSHDDRYAQLARLLDQCREPTADHDAGYLHDPSGALRAK